MVSLDSLPIATARLRAVMLVTAVLLVMAGCDSTEPSVATTLVPTGAIALGGFANTPVNPAPSVTLRDQRERGLANVLVRWQVTAGNGTVTTDTVRTDANGVASSGRWLLGTVAGPQSLTATVEGVAPVTFVATVAPGPPFRMVRRVPETQPTRVGREVAEPPSITLFDEYDNRIPGALVTFELQSGGGTIIGPTQRLTDAEGVVTMDGWRIGTSTSQAQVLGIRIEPIVQPLAFRASPIADSAVMLEAASTLRQDGVPQIGVSERPAVRARDQYGNPTGGVTVTFTPAPGSGSVTGSSRETSTNEGIARVGSWVLGNDSVQRLIARSPQFPSDSFVFEANAVPSVFFLETVFLNGEPSTRNLQAVERAVTRWRNVIVGQLEPARVIAGADACGPGVPALDEVIPNVRLYINFDSIDGPGSILGRAGPCIIRTASGLPVVGFVELDTADLVNLNTNGTLDDVMTHEFGHVLGLQSFNWNRRGLVVGLGGSDPIFQGAVGREQFQLIGGGTYTGIPVPLENTGGAGTRDSHWRISVLRRELMVGFAQAGGMPLSRLSVGALADLGYVVRLENAEAFTVPLFGTSAFGAMVMPGSGTVSYGDDSWPSAIWAVDRAGRQRLVRDGDWRVTRRGRNGTGSRTDGR
jgi:hypothetical protein